MANAKGRGISVEPPPAPESRRGKMVSCPRWGAMRDSTWWLLVLTALAGVAVQVHVSGLIDSHASHLETDSATPPAPTSAPADDPGCSGRRPRVAGHE